MYNFSYNNLTTRGITDTEYPFLDLFVFCSFMENQSPSSSSSSSSAIPKTEEMDAPLHSMGFEIEYISATKVYGSLHVTQKCCQPFKMLHGGVSAMIAESLASIGAHIACGYKRIAGVQLSINHLKPAVIGDFLKAEATPLNVGRSIQVWEVRIWKVDPSNSQNRPLIASSKVTVLGNMIIPDNAKKAMENLKNQAKL